MRSQTKPSPPGQEAPKNGLPEKLKQRLYPVVLDLFSQKDFHQVTLRTICSRSGLSPSTIYQYYSSKENLIFSILDEKISEIAPLVREHLKGLESTKEIFRKIFWVTMDYYDRNPGVAITAFITLPMRTWMGDPTYARQDTTDNIRRIVADGHKRGDLDPAVDYQQVTDLYFMFCYRQIHLWFYRGRNELLVETVPRFFPLAWKAVSNPDGQPDPRSGCQPMKRG
jgi:AcrR family transcriptional regulator